MRACVRACVEVERQSESYRYSSLEVGLVLAEKYVDDECLDALLLSVRAWLVWLVSGLSVACCDTLGDLDTLLGARDSLWDLPLPLGAQFPILINAQSTTALAVTRAFAPRATWLAKQLQGASPLAHTTYPHRKATRGLRRCQS